STAPALITFENLSKNADQYEWDFGDGNFSNDPAPKHRYRSSGNYEVVLRARKGRRTSVTRKRLQITQPLDCMVEIETEYGTMLVKLFNATPKHRDNFFKLAQEGFYDGLLFHRVIEGFMIQGGDPESRNAGPHQMLGRGGPGYQLPAEFVDSLIHVKGAVAAARLGDAVNPEKKSSGSQFYIVQGKVYTAEELDRIEAQKGIRYSPEQRKAYLTIGGTPFLDGEYTVFGTVVEGLEVIDRIAAQPVGQGNRPLKDIVMKVRPVQ
ncbi:MAG: PKD domain-containing protein, partial [Bacteroidetes bacterium]